MKIVRFRKGHAVSYGILEGDTVTAMDGIPFGEPVRAKARLDRRDIELLAPVCPTKVVAVGLNYLDHAKELNMSCPEEPAIFIKPPSAVIGPFATVYYPHQAKRVDYEAELAVAIKKKAKAVPENRAREHILGYTCLNDITARDLQKKDGQWTRSKSFDTFCPIGPHIETDLDTASLRIESYVNERLKQSSNTSNMIFTCYRLLHFISGIMTLEPGDIIATGTPAGIGPVAIGDDVEVKIEGIGSLKNTIGKT